MSKSIPSLTDLVGSIPWLQAAWTGQFDGATLQVERAFMQPYATVAGTVVLFAGRISEVHASRTGVDIKCRSHLELLNIQMPRRLWQPSCTHVFGDAMCQFDRNSLALTFPCVAGSTSTVIQGAPATADAISPGLDHRNVRGEYRRDADDRRLCPGAIGYCQTRFSRHTDSRR